MKETKRKRRHHMSKDQKEGTLGRQIKYKSLLLQGIDK